jgi:hypothetical protein
MENNMQSLKQFWGSFRLLPSAWLLLVQLALLVMAMLTYGDSEYRALTWSLGVLALLIIAKVIRQTPVFTFWGLIFVSGAFLFSILIFIGYDNSTIQIIAYSFEALAYFYAAYGLLRYMFADRYLTKDELFAAGAVFTSSLGHSPFYIVFASCFYPIVFKTQISHKIYKFGSIYYF